MRQNTWTAAIHCHELRRHSEHCSYLDGAYFEVIALCTFNHIETDYSVQNNALFFFSFKSYMFCSKTIIIRRPSKKNLKKIEVKCLFWELFQMLWRTYIFTITVSFLVLYHRGGRLCKYYDVPLEFLKKSPLRHGR